MHLISSDEGRNFNHQFFSNFIQDELAIGHFCVLLASEPVSSEG
jgi:hypothetical protein